MVVFEERRVENQQTQLYSPSPGIEPRPHWWRVSALTTASTDLLLPKQKIM